MIERTIESSELYMQRTIVYSEPHILENHTG